MYTNYITGDKSAAPSRPSRMYPELRGHETRLALKDSFLEPGTPRESVYRKKIFEEYDGRAGLEVQQKAKRHRWRRAARVARPGAGVTRRTRDHQSQRRAGRCAQEWKPGAPHENVSDDVPK